MDNDKRVMILLEARLVLGRIVYSRTLTARVWIAIFFVLWIVWLWFTQDTYSTLENLTRILVLLPIFVAHWHLRKLERMLEILYLGHQLTGDLNDARIDVQSREEKYFGEEKTDEG